MKDEAPTAVRSSQPPRPGAGSNWSVGLGPGFTQGDAPSPVLGAIAYGAVRKGSFEVVFEGHATLTGGAATDLGRVSSWSVSGLGGVCGHVSVFFGCAMGGVGMVIAEADVPVLRKDRALVAYAGPRAGVLLPIGSRFELRVQGDALVALARHRLAIDATDVYEYAPGRIGVASLLGMRF